MKKTLMIFALSASFGVGFAFNSILGKTAKDQSTMKRVTGIGGIFFKCQNPGKIRDWYKTHLGLDMGGCLKRVSNVIRSI